MTKSYTTISGDMWDKIAFEQMGSVLHTDKLMKAFLVSIDIFKAYLP